MSTNLIPIGNHSLDFCNPQEQYAEVLDKLNTISLDNDFIYEFQKGFLLGREEVTYTGNIRWRVVEPTIKRNEIGVMFLADYFLQIHICRHTIELFAPFRYYVLERLSDDATYQAFMNWRHVWTSIVKGLGGDKIVYLSDSGFDKYLELHWDKNSMDKIIEELKLEHGDPLNDILELRKGLNKRKYLMEYLE